MAMSMRFLTICVLLVFVFATLSLDAANPNDVDVEALTPRPDSFLSRLIRLSYTFFRLGWLAPAAFWHVQPLLGRLLLDLTPSVVPSLTLASSSAPTSSPSPPLSLPSSPPTPSSPPPTPSPAPTPSPTPTPSPAPTPQPSTCLRLRDFFRLSVAAYGVIFTVAFGAALFVLGLFYDQPLDRVGREVVGGVFTGVAVITFLLAHVLPD